jgi:uncharacterized membrane protein (DUF4010 family)
MLKNSMLLDVGMNAVIMPENSMLSTFRIMLLIFIINAGLQQPLCPLSARKQYAPKYVDNAAMFHHLLPAYSHFYAVIMPKNSMLSTFRIMPLIFIINAGLQRPLCGLYALFLPENSMLPSM